MTLVVQCEAHGQMKGRETSQLIFTCLNSTVETLEKGVKYIQNQQWKHQNDDVNEVVLVFLLLTVNIVYVFFSVSVVYFERENVSWDFGNIDWKQTGLMKRKIFVLSHLFWHSFS